MCIRDRVELRAATRTVAVAEPFAAEQGAGQAVVVELTGEITDLVAIDSTGREVDRFAAGPGGEGPTEETVPVPTTTG